MPKMDPSVLLKTLERRAKQATEDGLPFWGIVSGIDGSRVAVRPLSADSNAYELMARGQGIVNVGDTGICCPIAGGGLMFMRAQGSTAPGTDLIVPIEFESLALASGPNTSTPLTLISGSTPTVPAGTYGAVLRASAVMWRSVTTGGCWMQLTLDSKTSTAHMLSTDGLTMTAPLTYATAIVVTPSSPLVKASAGTFPITLLYRGSTVAGTTNILNAQIDGFLYRIS